MVFRASPNTFHFVASVCGFIHVPLFAKSAFRVELSGLFSEDFNAHRKEEPTED